MPAGSGRTSSASWRSVSPSARCSSPCAPSRGHRVCWSPRGAGSPSSYRSLRGRCWLALYAARQPAPARLQAQLDLTASAAVTVAVLGALALATGGRRADSVDQRVAHRLLVSALLTAAVVLLVLDVVPIVLRGSPLVAREVLALVLVPVVLACWVAAVLGYRLVEIDATLRRYLVQLVLASLVGAVFLAAANAVNLAAGTSVRLDGHGGSGRAGPPAGGAAAAPYREPPRVRRPRLPLPSGLRAAARGADDGPRERAGRDADHAQPQPRPGLRAHRVDRVDAGGQVRRRAR